MVLGIDYLSDISQWRYHCAIEDTFVQGTVYICTTVRVNVLVNTLFVYDVLGRV